MKINFFLANKNQIKHNPAKNIFNEKKSGKDTEKEKLKIEARIIITNKKNHEERRKIIKETFSFCSTFILGCVMEKPKDVNAESSTSNEENRGFFTKSGLEIIDYEEGNGQKLEWGDFIIVNYVIYRNNSGNLVKLSDTYEKNNPFSYIHGSGQTIKGIEEAVHSMKKGGKRRVVIPDELAYNVSGLGPIPPEIWKRKKIFQKDNGEKSSSFLLFDIELVDIKKNDFNQKWFNNKISMKKAETLLQPK